MKAREQAVFSGRQFTGQVAEVENDSSGEAGGKEEEDKEEVNKRRRRKKKEVKRERERESRRRELGRLGQRETDKVQQYIVKRERLTAEHTFPRGESLRARERERLLRSSV